MNNVYKMLELISEATKNACSNVSLGFKIFFGGGGGGAKYGAAAGI